ncbi:hypothetical protein AB1Y20_023708 [Prymnesium parvum]|uniref:Glycoside hydrolase family 2 catalytic domain-containing protein n=1 Tax=Prymnesium parvum TaxID=97485 RepID=A0AB34JH05_PRYPA
MALPQFPNFSRPTTALTGEWRFGFDAAFGDVTAPLDPRAIATPFTAHVPSAFDVASPGERGRRGTAFYRTTLPLPPHHRGRLHFAACAFYCRVFLDSLELGDHRAGGYVPFWLDVPPAAAAARELLVLADNRFNASTAPTHTGGDFYMYGGLTRAVTLHDLGAPSRGAYFDFVGAAPINASAVRLRVALRAARALERVGVAFDGGRAPTSFVVAHGRGELELAVPCAQLWSVGAPRLHTLTATLHNGDAVTVRFGLRVLSVDEGGGIRLNGAPLQLKGVNRHTMSPASGSALTLAEVRRDVALLVELGANYVRGAHYPQDQAFLELCDEAGLLVWEEALGPQVTLADMRSPAFMAAQLQQLDEMVLASYSHPSVIIHAFFNEGPSDDPAACFAYNASARAIRALVAPSHRLVTWASSAKEKDVCLGAADVLSFNDYPGWYTASIGQVRATWAAHAAWAKAHFASKPFLISETGGGGIFEWRNASAPKWSQEYQEALVRADVQAALGLWPQVAGISIWQFSDIKADDGATAACGSCVYSTPYDAATPMNCSYISASCWRPGGENHKGLLDFWRRKKLAFHAVKALFAQNDSMLAADEHAAGHIELL